MANKYAKPKPSGDDEKAVDARLVQSYEQALHSRPTPFMELMAKGSEELRSMASELRRKFPQTEDVK